VDVEGEIRGILALEAEGSAARRILMVRYDEPPIIYQVRE